MDITEKQIEEILVQAKEILKKVDTVADDLEGDRRFLAMNEMNEFMLEWNLLIHNFTSRCIQDYIK